MADARPESFYQTVNFHFRVDFDINGSEVDIRFQSVAGLDSTLDTETIKEGGENRFEHVLPVRRKYGPLTLKRGLLKPKDSDLTKWLKKCFDEEKVNTIDKVNINLLGEDHQPLMHWTINNVWPRSWKIGELNAEKGEVLIETLELNYNRLIFDDTNT
jgi:phage tail-like protein